MIKQQNQIERGIALNQHIERSRPRGGYGWLGVVLLGALLIPSPVIAAAAKKGKFAVVGKGQGNTATGNYATVAGGQTNTASSLYATVGGGSLNTASGTNATVGGGLGNSASGGDATVGGGAQNGASGGDATVGGGEDNSAGGDFATVGGGQSNDATGQFSTVGGGQVNTASGANATVGGGQNNDAGGDDATIGGGEQNVASGIDATVGGGNGNDASGEDATVGGGFQNDASADLAAVGGGNKNIADGGGATVPGGGFNHASGTYSMAAGVRANATLDGTFVWNSFVGRSYSFRPNTFQVSGYNGLDVEYFDQRVDGGGSRWIYVGPAVTGQTIATWTGAYLSDAGVWQNNSDRSRKTDFVPAQPQEVLEKLAALPVSTWHYTTETAAVRHLGPTAQDFKAAFGLGSDEKTIGTVDEEGVALAAIQGLNQKLEAQVKEKDARIAALERRLTDLEAKMQ